MKKALLLASLFFMSGCSPSRYCTQVEQNLACFDVDFQGAVLTSTDPSGKEVARIFFIKSGDSLVGLNGPLTDKAYQYVQKADTLQISADGNSIVLYRVP